MSNLDADEQLRRDRGPGPDHRDATSGTLRDILLDHTSTNDEILAAARRIVCELPKQFRRSSLPAKTIAFIAGHTGELLMQQPNLVHVEAPVNICGDLHGQYQDLLYMFGEVPPINGKYLPEAQRQQLLESGRILPDDDPLAAKSGNYLFLGDYVDRGNNSIETIVTLCCYKLLEPDRFTLLRGNHESSVVTRTYGFLDECKRRYNIGMWKLFCDVFNRLPAAALVEKAILCMHGGISPDLVHLEDINKLKRPSEVGDMGLLCDLLWSDPMDREDELGWAPSSRGVSFYFGIDKLTEFMVRNDLDLICRAHQVVEYGYRFFGPQRQLVTVFSATNYCGEYANKGGMLRVDHEMKCSFMTFER